jgi:predicted ATPase
MASAGAQPVVLAVEDMQVNRVVGEIALKLPDPDIAKAEVYFDRALVVARAQQAKSWELGAAMSMARLWRDQGKRDEARKLLAPVYGWFTEGFDTLDLKEAKKLLEELAGVRRFITPAPLLCACPRLRVRVSRDRHSHR